MLFRIKAGDREFYLVRASERPMIKKPSVDVAQVRALKARGRRPSFYRKDAGHRPGVRLQGAGNLRQFDMSSVIFPC
jgi:hypothetical protein